VALPCSAEAEKAHRNPLANNDAIKRLFKDTDLAKKTIHHI